MADRQGQNELAQTLDRGLEILTILANTRRPLTAAQIAQQLGVSRPIAYRLLNTLRARQLVARNDDGSFRLATGVLEFARGISPDLQAAALPEMSELTEDYHATTLLVIADGDEAVCLTTLEPRGPHVRLSYPPGVRHPLYLTASGMAILAGREPQPDERRDITKARKRGYASSYGELQPVSGVGVAAPIIVGDQPAEASIAVVSLDPGRLREEEAGPRVVEAAKRIAANLW